MNQSLTESATIDAQEIVRYSKLLRRGGFYFNLFTSIIILSTSINYAILALSFEINFVYEICCVQIENAMNESFIYKFHLI